MKTTTMMAIICFTLITSLFIVPVLQWAFKFQFTQGKLKLVHFMQHEYDWRRLKPRAWFQSPCSWILMLFCCTCSSLRKENNQGASSRLLSSPYDVIHANVALTHQFTLLCMIAFYLCRKLKLDGKKEKKKEPEKNHWLILCFKRPAAAISP